MVRITLGAAVRASTPCKEAWAARPRRLRAVRLLLLLLLRAQTKAKAKFQHGHRTGTPARGVVEGAVSVEECGVDLINETLRALDSRLLVWCWC